MSQAFDGDDAVGLETFRANEGWYLVGRVIDAELTTGVESFSDKSARCAGMGKYLHPTHYSATGKALIAYGWRWYVYLWR